ncbi:MAG: hypothetical protein ACRDPY_22600 [Streptosporangiaceae bacterium]
MTLIVVSGAPGTGKSTQAPDPPRRDQSRYGRPGRLLADTVTPLGLGQALITIDTRRDDAWVQAVTEARAAVDAGRRLDGGHRDDGRSGQLEVGPAWQVSSAERRGVEHLGLAESGGAQLVLDLVPRVGGNDRPLPIAERLAFPASIWSPLAVVESLAACPVSRGGGRLGR